MRTFHINIDGTKIKGKAESSIRSLYDGREVGRVNFGGPQEVEFTIESSCKVST